MKHYALRTTPSTAHHASLTTPPVTRTTHHAPRSTQRVARSTPPRTQHHAPNAERSTHLASPTREAPRITMHERTNILGELLLPLDCTCVQSAITQKLQAAAAAPSAATVAAMAWQEMLMRCVVNGLHVVHVHVFYLSLATATRCTYNHTYAHNE